MNFSFLDATLSQPTTYKLGRWEILMGNRCLFLFQCEFGRGFYLGCALASTLLFGLEC